jgi:hypothetical protein
VLRITVKTIVTFLGPLSRFSTLKKKQKIFVKIDPVGPRRCFESLLIIQI